MKVVLILSMALVALVSKSFAAPSMVLLPAYNHEDIDNEKRDTVVEDVDKASNPYQAVEVPDDDEGRQEIVPLVSAFGLRKAKLLELYQHWLPKVPAGEDSSFKAFLDWMKEQEKRENADETDKKDGEKRSSDDTDSLAGPPQKRAICDSRTIANWKRKLGECGINRYKRSAYEEERQINQPQEDTETDKEDEDGEDDDEAQDEEDDDDDDEAQGTQQRRALCNFQNIADWKRKLAECGIRPKIGPIKLQLADETGEDKRSTDEEEPQINQPEVATTFGLTETALENLYMIWLPKVPEGDDTSFPAFVKWMKEQNKDEPEAVGTQQRRAICNSRTIAKWKRKLGECGINQYKRSADEDEPQINQLQVDTNGEESDDDEEEDDDDEEDDEEEVEDRQSVDGTQQRRAICNSRTIAKWRRKLGECGIHPKIQLNKAETGTEPESVDETDEDKRSADEEESQINQPEVATNFGLTEAQLGDLYRMWVPTVPAGKDKSFQAFVDWMNKNDDEKDDDAVHAGTHFYRKVIKWTAKILRGGRRKEKREYLTDEQQLTEVQRSIDVEETPINHQEVATEFGLTRAGLEELYRIWIQKVPAEGDTSFKAFVNWLKENDDRPENDRTVRAGTRSWNDYAKWGSGSNYFGKKPKKDYISDEQQLAEDQRSIDESQPQVDQQELATITEDKRDFAAWLKKVFTPWKPKKTRGLKEDEAPTITEDKRDFFAKLRDAFKPRKPKKTRGFEDFEEDAQQDIISGLQGSLAARDLQPSFKPGPKSANFERREGEEEEQKIPVKEEEEKIPVKVTDESKDTSDTNGGYSCEENSPCNIENIANEQFYFATASSDKFIQCDAWGGCHTLTCEDGLVWDDLIKTCGLRT